MREYKKPEIQAEKFIPNVAVAACSVEQLHELNTAPVSIVCANSGMMYDAVFGRGNTGCANLICHFVWIPTSGNYKSDELRSLGLENLKCSDGEKGVYVPEGGAYVGCWSGKRDHDGTTSHYGLLTEISSSVINSSY